MRSILARDFMMSWADLSLTTPDRRRLTLDNLAIARSRMKLPLQCFSILSFLLLSIVSGLEAQSAHQASLVESAKKEGRLVWYTSMAIDTSKPLLDAFEKQYPFIKAELVRAGEEQLMNRILSETRAGK